ncbi:hypothetical protein CK203_046744 [Vitis vinifera]|uniref:Uncharacterized protein n=1 Tax=Vitis vinifera TaxID=29760 RepID=A0A438H2L7_VITVI|nr:hypothetical protein CK203_046744 [Vitis vinifera]
MFGDQANVVGQFKPNNNAPYGNTYNSSWKNHPNFSWKARATQYQQPDQPSQQSSSLEQAIANLSKCKKREDFLLNPHQNPKGVHEVESQEGESSTNERCQIVQSMQGKNNGEEENRVMKTGDTAAVFHCTFGALPEVHFLHSIYHFKAEKVKNPTIQNHVQFGAEMRKIYGLRKTTASS